ncbi:TraR/DksA C4-type zinc finger protein [Dethiothermospora halolimnae]|uniref:TraR/DksA C4-type zinc finger protein n=1 Tax=Dethiothermospora halolimnae TaxID=3114390 RepID=UPI003CCB960F
MDKNKLDHYKKLLLNEKKELRQNMKNLSKNMNDSMPEYFDELSMYDNHSADLGAEMFMAEHNMNLKNFDKSLLSEIDISLDKIKDGSYGKCELCGNDIKEERLEIIPHAKTCVDCVTDESPVETKIDYRPLEEEALGFPFGRSFKDISEEDTVEFDGEDSYQAVARYNEVKDDESYSGGDDLGVYDERDPGIVEEVEQISEGYYKGQLEGYNREDIPDEQKVSENKYEDELD